MTQDEIVEMYLQVSKELCNDTEWCWAGVGEPLQMFAKLIAAKALAQRTWVGLTDDEMENTFIQCGGKWNGDYWEIEDADFHPFLRTIEAKLKERNT